MFMASTCRLSNLNEGGESNLAAIDVKGLVNVVPQNRLATE